MLGWVGWSYIRSRAVVLGFGVGHGEKCPHIWSRTVMSMLGELVSERAVVYRGSDCTLRG